MIYVSDFLKAAQLRQYPPQRRTMRFIDQRPLLATRGDPASVKTVTVSIQFPWLTFGGLTVTSQVPKDTKPRRVALPLVFAHDRAWTNLKDALWVLRRIPAVFHGITDFGYVCMGGAATAKLRNRTLSVEDAFWGTTNTIVVLAAPRPESVFENVLDFCNPAHFSSVVDYSEPLVTLGRIP